MELCLRPLLSFALEDGDVDGAESIWSKAAVLFLSEATQNAGYSDLGINRGTPPKFVTDHNAYPSSEELATPDGAISASTCIQLLGHLLDALCHYAV